MVLNTIIFSSLAFGIVAVLLGQQWSTLTETFGLTLGIVVIL
jgi:hypothetical protein